jgi:hypothetical protein
LVKIRLKALQVELVVHHVKLIIRIDLPQIVLVPLPLQILLILKIAIGRIVGIIELCPNIGGAHNQESQQANEPETHFHLLFLRCRMLICDYKARSTKAAIRCNSAAIQRGCRLTSDTGLYEGRIITRKKATQCAVDGKLFAASLSDRARNG